MNSCQNKIKLSNIKKSYDNRLILNDISIYVNKGELVSIVGPSGCGKSTIFNIITELTNVDEGKVSINGRVSYMYQKDMMVPWKKVIDNIGLPLLLKGQSKSQAREEVLKHIKDFGLEGFEYVYPSKLSGGMKQRANFLKTYLTSNDIMLLDEPFGALDSITRRKMQQWLSNIAKEINATILFITHDIDEAILLSDRVYVLSDKPGRIKGEVKVQFDNKSVENLEITEEFVSIKRELINIIE